MFLDQRGRYQQTPEKLLTRPGKVVNAPKNCKNQCFWTSGFRYQQAGKVDNATRKKPTEQKKTETALRLPPGTSYSQLVTIE